MDALSMRMHLIGAISNSNPERLRTLLSNEICTPEYLNQLEIRCQAGHDIRTERYTLLGFALLQSNFNKFEIFRILVEHDMDIYHGFPSKASVGQHYAPFIVAFYKRDDVAICFLLNECKLDINRYKDYLPHLRHYMCFQFHLEDGRGARFYFMLLRAGYSVTLEDREYFTSIEGVYGESTEIVAMFRAYESMLYLLYPGVEKSIKLPVELMRVLWRSLYS